MAYSLTFQEKMVEKMLGPEGMSIRELARKSGVSSSTLARWRRAAMVGDMSDGKKRQETTHKARRPQDWSPQERLEAVAQAATLSEEELGAFLRREGLREGHLEQWRQAMLQALDTPAQRRRRQRNSAQSRRIRELERELRRKDQALAETAALLALKKKAQAIWGDEDDDTR